MYTASSAQPRVRPAGRRPIATRLVLVAVAALFVRTWVAQSFSIPGGSMEPALLAGDFVLVDRFVFGPTLENDEHGLPPMRAVRRGDVVVARLPADPRRHLVKRVVGLPGETLALRGATVYVDGVPLAEPYLPPTPPDRDERVGPVTIPPQHYFVLGDNRAHSQDSRLWGALPHESITGRVVATYWSSAPPEVVALPAGGPAESLRRRARAAARFLRETRWNRVLRPVR
ncbi:MAG: signal peptidase I [Acidobacteria bacterium]|nr:signal peptidase I [Acidobacteriota bacterium]